MGKKKRAELQRQKGQRKIDEQIRKKNEKIIRSKRKGR